MRQAVNQNRQSQRQAVMKSITGLMQDLQKLSPHPAQPNNTGPLFIKNNPNFKVANERDGALGSMLLEGLLGTAFSDAVSETLGSCAQDLDMQSFDPMAAMEAYSEYITDIEESSQKIAAHGQGTLARLSGKSISGSFNMRSSISSPMQNFMDDLPQRMKIEHNLAYFAKQLDILDADIATPTPQYAGQSIAA